jgi:hypothetical protein
MGLPLRPEVKTISYPFGDQEGEDSKELENVRRTGRLPDSDTLKISVLPLTDDVYTISPSMAL